jgi:allantoinase
MQLDLVVRARRAITASGEISCSVGVQDGRVVVVESFSADLNGTQSITLSDDEVLLPGLVDTHVHINDPGRSDWETFPTATRAAAAGGVTTLLDMPLNSIPPTCDPAALALKRETALGHCYVDVGFWAGAIPANLGQLRALHEAGVFGFKCFMLDSGVAEFPPLDSDQLALALQEVASFDGLMIAHAEDPWAIEHADAPHGRSYADFLGSRPSAAEDVAIAQLIQAARVSGARVHVVHLSSATALPLLQAAQNEGLPVSAESCPHYLYFAAEEVPDGATQFKCCPPIRDAPNRELLWAGLQQQILGSIASDHSPCVPELKQFESGDFGAAWGGVSSLQLGLPAVWTQARLRHFELTDVVRWMAHGPARLAGLDRKGRIAVGVDADFCVLAPDATFTVDVSELHYKNPVSPYAGAQLNGVVRSTWLRGRQISSHGDVADPATGALLVRGKA